MTVRSAIGPIHTPIQHYCTLLGEDHLNPRVAAAFIGLGPREKSLALAQLRGSASRRRALRRARPSMERRLRREDDPDPLARRVPASDGPARAEQPEAPTARRTSVGAMG